MRTWMLVASLIVISASANAKDKLLPLVYVTGASSVCPGSSYVYSLVASSSCAVSSYSWNVIGGTITADDGTLISVEWTDPTRRGVSATITSACGQTSAGFVNGSINFMVPNMRPATPSAPTVTGSTSTYPATTGVFCAGDVLTVSADNSENTNASTNDDVYLVFEVSVNGTGFDPLAATANGSVAYSTSLSNPKTNSANTFVFRVKKYYKLCTAGVSDYSNESATAFVYVRTPPPTISVVDQICTNSASTKVTFTVSGAGSNIFVAQTSAGSYAGTSPLTIPGLSSGNYQFYFYYYDQPNNTHSYCPSSSSAQSFSIGGQTIALGVTATPVQETCNNLNNGRINVSISNGTAPYSFSWTGTSSSSQNLTNLSPGIYSVNVRDYNGCTGSASASLSSQPILNISSVITSSYNGKDISCAGKTDGQVTVSSSGGTGSGSGYTFTLDGLSSGSGKTSYVYGGLAAGSHTVTVTDLNLCRKTSIVTLTQPPAVAITSTSVIPPTCSGSQQNGNVSVTASGGTGVLKYILDGSAQGGSSFPVLPGVHSIKVIDINGCSAANSISVNQPITANYSTSVASCSTVNDGSITVTGASGGTGSYTYSLDGTVYQASNMFSNKANGDYTIYVKDGNSCVFTTNTATIGLKTPVSGSISQTSSINCFGQTTAAFNVTPSGGTSPYTSYSWSNGESGSSVPSAGAGNYIVTITDSKGCIGTASILITQPSPLSSSTTTSLYNGFNISCKGGNDGFINLTPSGGTAPYTYSWSTGSTAQNLSGLTAGAYAVTITDARNCTVPQSAALTEPPSNVTVRLSSSSDVTCYGDNNGSIIVTGAGGVGAISYSKDNWTTSQLSSTFLSLSTASYTVSVRDANNCSASTSPIVINSPPTLTISSIVKTSPLCNGEVMCSKV